jgi:quaternary ammonium compound-resistance protein SugE
MTWFILLTAGLLEITWAVGLKYTQGFSIFWPSFWTVLAMVGSVVLLALAMKKLPIGTAYAIWTGIGAIGTAIFGILLFDEPIDWKRMLSLTFIVCGIVGLKLASK